MTQNNILKLRRRDHIRIKTDKILASLIRSPPLRMTNLLIKTNQRTTAGNAHEESVAVFIFHLFGGFAIDGTNDGSIGEEKVDEVGESFL